MIPAVALIVTRNGEAGLARCLDSLRDFARIVVVDSASTDHTVAIARQYGAEVIDFQWNGAYPKKRQWCLDHWAWPEDWVFFIDADEVLSPALAAEMADLFARGTPACAGYFVRGRYVEQGRVLDYGLHNNKLCLFNRHYFSFPVIDDLDLPMGEIEGHYQPQKLCQGEKIGQLRAPVLHYATEDRAAWRARHERYALWEAGMNRRKAWPADPVLWREALKRVFRAMPGRAVLAFAHAYFFKGGILCGGAGLRQACDRYIYYRMIARAMRLTPAPQAVERGEAAS
jgi:glycosyltransferase involved in cell wall biosynthesis